MSFDVPVIVKRSFDLPYDLDRRLDATAKKVGIATAEYIRQLIAKAVDRRNVNISGIIDLVAIRYGYTAAEIRSDRRPQGLADARAIAMWISREVFPEFSLQMIGREFGGKDHGTVLHNCAKIRDLRDAYPTVKADTDELLKSAADMIAALPQPLSLPLPSMPKAGEQTPQPLPLPEQRAA
jgi:chromosomal replication initiation ATPase DnaA